MTKTLVFPGTFDPITLGHIDLAARASVLFQEIIIAISVNPRKQPLFTIEQRIELAKKALSHLTNIKVMGFEGLLVDFMQAQKAQVVLRGVRGAADLEYELQLANTNRRLYPKLETLFLTPSEKYHFTTSTLVREVAFYGGDVSQFVPEVVNAAIKKLK
jgi:pantetheine-phosphate adenylyltransferase